MARPSASTARLSILAVTSPTAMPVSNANGATATVSTLDLPLALRTLFANPLVRQDAGRVALHARPAGLLRRGDRQRRRPQRHRPARRDLPAQRPIRARRSRRCRRARPAGRRASEAGWGTAALPHRARRTRSRRRRASCPITSGTTARPARCWSGSRRRDRSCDGERDDRHQRRAHRTCARASAVWKSSTAST